MIAVHGLRSRFSGNTPPALNAVFLRLLEEHADERELDGAMDLLQEEVTVPAFEAIQSDEYGDQTENEQQVYNSFQNALRADGLDLVEGRVVPFLSPTVDLAREQGGLEARLDDYKFTVTCNHLDQVIDNTAGGNWEAANGQIRSFLESLCNDIVRSICVEDGGAPTGGDARKHLRDVGFLSEKESELLKALFAVLHGEGAHPGTSSEDDSHRRRLMAFAMANYYLDRLNDWSESR